MITSQYNDDHALYFSSYTSVPTHVWHIGGIMGAGGGALLRSLNLF